MEPGETAEPMMFEFSIPVNRFLLPETINGLCTAYAYVNSDDWEAGGRPVLYADNNNYPQSRKSMNEGFIDLRVVSGKPAGWRSATFSSNGSIASGSNIWFGVYCEYYWMPRFDWGARCFADWYSTMGSIPNTYPLSQWTEIYDFKLSMYFEYSSAQNYIRTLMQGVNLSDSRILTANYKRVTQQGVQANTVINRFQSICRKFQEAVQGLEISSSPVLFHRSINETTTITETISHLTALFRGLADNAGIESGAKLGGVFSLKLIDSVQAAGSVFRGLILSIRIVTGLYVRDYLLNRFLKARSELDLKSCIIKEITLDSRIG
jgi:hypothetical protein